MAQFIDWKALLEGFDEAPEEEKERVRAMLLDMPKRLLEDLFEKELYARLLYEKAVGPWTPPVEWTKELERKLKDVFEASFTRAGVSPRRFMAEYRLELSTIKLLETEDEMIKAVEALAAEILRREIKPPKIRPPKPPKPEEKPRVISPFREEEEEEEEYIPYGPPVTPAFPLYPLSPAPFPRNLSIAEKEQIWRAFMDELTMRGIDATTYRKEFDDWLGTFTFKTWSQVTKHFESLLEQIQTGKVVLFPVHEVIVPWDTTEEAVVHFASIGIYKTLDEMITSLYSYGFDTTDEEVRNIIKEQYRKGNHELIISDKEYLESLVGQKIG